LSAALIERAAPEANPPQQATPDQCREAAIRDLPRDSESPHQISTSKPAALCCDPERLAFEPAQIAI